jgi:hypothetical protein
MHDSATAQDQLIEALTWHDEQTRAKRAERILWASKFKPDDGLVIGKLEPLSVLEEARACFVNECYVAAMLTSTAFIDHALASILSERGIKTKNALKDRIDAARKNDILPTGILDEIDNVRMARNPFAHQMPTGHAMNLSTRFQVQKRHPQAILEEDAKKALELMYELYRRTLRPVKLTA